jgi:hypothetical protein
MRPTGFFRSIALVLAITGSSLAQPQGQPCDALCEKRMEIAKYVEIERNPAIAADLKTMNGQRLHDARVELRLLLRQNTQVAQDLLVGVTDEQKKVLQDKIDSLNAELAAIETALAAPGKVAAAAAAGASQSPDSSPGSAAAVTPPASPGPVVVNQGTTVTSLTKVAGVAAARVAAGKACSATQSTSSGTLSILSRGAASLVVDRKKVDAASGQLSQAIFVALANAVAPAQTVAHVDTVLARLFVEDETRRDDKQLGAPGGAGNSLVEKANFARLLGFAIEHGGVEQQVSGTALTLSSSPYALFAAQAGGDTAETYRQYASFTRLGVSATFNIQDPNNVRGVLGG